VATPYGDALQSNHAAALGARTQVEQGATLHRIGTMGKSQAAEPQFSSLENPSSPGYAARYGHTCGERLEYEFRRDSHS